MRMTDRQIALSMMYMENPDRSYIMGLLPPGKVNRIREELTMHGRLAIGYPQYAAAVEAVLEGLSPGGNGGRFRSYLRPRRYVR